MDVLVNCSDPQRMDIPMKASYATDDKLAMLGALAILMLCGLSYCSFHAIRPALSAPKTPNWLSYVEGSFPSLLLGIAMVASTGLVPSIRFRNQKQRIWFFSAALLVAVVWFEVVVPWWVPTSVGSWADGVAMYLGALLSIGLLRSPQSVTSETILKQSKNSPFTRL